MILLKQRIEKPLTIEARKSDIHGTGVFARNNLRAGDIIEKAPLILLDTGEKELLQNTVLFDYYFLLNNGQKPIALALGMASLYNHATNPNATYSILFKKELLIIKAVCSISVGTEITINYHGQPGDETAVHFSQ